MGIDKQDESRKHEKRLVSERQELRHDDPRRLEARIAELKPKIDVLYVSPLHVPDEVIPLGWTYHWVRTSLLDVPDVKRESFCKMNGWNPVPADRHPEIFNMGLTGRKITDHGYVEYCGLLLCEMPTYIYDKIKQKISDQHLSEVRGLKGLEGLGRDGKIFGNEVSYGFGD